MNVTPARNITPLSFWLKNVQNISLKLLKIGQKAILGLLHCKIFPRCVRLFDVRSLFDSFFDWKE